MASHRLIQHVGKKYGLRVSEGLYDRLNVYYFVEGHALNDRPRLAKVAAEELRKLVPNEEESSIMTQDDILHFLNGNEGREEILHALSTLKEIGVHGIPKFIIEGQTIIDGAAKSDIFVQVFREIEQRGETAGTAIFGDILGVSDDTILKGSHTRDNIDLAA